MNAVMLASKTGSIYAGYFLTWRLQRTSRSLTACQFCMLHFEDIQVLETWSVFFDTEGSLYLVIWTKLCVPQYAQVIFSWFLHTYELTHLCSFVPVYSPYFCLYLPLSMLNIQLKKITGDSCYSEYETALFCLHFSWHLLLISFPLFICCYLISLFLFLSYLSFSLSPPSFMSLLILLISLCLITISFCPITLSYLLHTYSITLLLSHLFNFAPVCFYHFPPISFHLLNLSHMVCPSFPLVSFVSAALLFSCLFHLYVSV